MRVFAVSDLHVDFAPNAAWVRNISLAEYRDDILILAGDVSDDIGRLSKCLEDLALRFRTLLFVPGNHDLWIRSQDRARDSFEKFDTVIAAANASGAITAPHYVGDLAVVPLFSWYDYSFGAPSEDLRNCWRDFYACRWPVDVSPPDVCRDFLSRTPNVSLTSGTTLITFSHFVPRIDVMPNFIPDADRWVYPVLGSTLIDDKVREMKARFHVYGHSHVNRRVTFGGVTYINNAFGYPRESGIARKQLVCIRPE